MTNLDYWQTLVGEQNPEEFLRTYGTADPDVGLERFLEDRGHFYGVLNQGDWATTFTAEKQCHVLTARVYLRSYLEETREDWQPALESRPPKVVRRYKPVYDLPTTDSKSDVQSPADTAEDDVATEAPSPAPADGVEDIEKSDASTDLTTAPENPELEEPQAAPSEEAVADVQDPATPESTESTETPETKSNENRDVPDAETTSPESQGS